MCACVFSSLTNYTGGFIVQLHHLGKQCPHYKESLIITLSKLFYLTHAGDGKFKILLYFGRE